jgi:hypothetical protein
MNPGKMCLKFVVPFFKNFSVFFFFFLNNWAGRGGTGV